MRRRAGIWLIPLAVAMSTCVTPTAVQEPDQACRQGLAIGAVQIPSCLVQQGVLSSDAGFKAESVLRVATDLRDSLRQYGDTANFRRAADMTRALAHASDFYARGFLSDTARLNRILDHVAVTGEFVLGELTQSTTYSLRWYSKRTPGLVWVYYPNNGLFYVPTATYQARFMIFPDPNTPTDSLAETATGMARYILHRQRAGIEFGVWEFDFYWQTAGIFLSPPWVSAMAQGGGLALFTEMYRRTGSLGWRDAAYEVFNSYKVHWQDGGVWLSDTLHGYWWDEYDPVDRVWNGSVSALIHLGYFAQVIKDPDAQYMYERGVEAVKYWTPFYDTGTWTRYSLNQGLNSRFYHQWEITLLDALFQQTGDPWFRDLATKWRSYVPPPGVP